MHCQSAFINLILFIKICKKMVSPLFLSDRIILSIIMAERVLLAISVIVHGKRSGEIYEKMDLHLVGSRNCSWPYEWLQQKCGNAGIGSVAGT